MASSNKHWPSMFKSKPCNNPHHQWQHNDHLLPSAGCHRTPYSSGPGCEERTPEPKPRWNPKPEQIRILEAIFNSGMVNPPREEIRKIRVQLQEYGQVGDANVFYWFQNRKSRSKHKQRQQIQNAKSQPQQTATPPPPPPISTPATNATAFVSTAAGLSSSSSSDKSSPNNSNEKPISLGPSIADLLNSPSANSVNQQQPFLHPPADFLPETFLFPVQTTNPVGGSSLPGFCSFDVPNIVDQGLENCPNYLLNELMLMDQFPPKKDDDIEKMKVQQNLGFPAQTIAPPSIPISNQISQGVGMAGQAPTRSTVFINDVCFEVAPVPLNVRETFGEDVVLVHSSGQAVLTNGWGETLQPLQHGGVYYLLHPFAPSDRTIDLIW